MQVRVEGSDSYESLAAKVAAKVDIAERHWYLTFLGKDLRHVLRPTSVLHRDSTIRMCSRLLGGAPSNPLLENGSVQHVIEEDAGLLVELASVAWHRDQEAPLRFSLRHGGAIKGKGVLWEESLCAVPISVPLSEGHLLHSMVPVSKMLGPPLPVAIEGNLSLLPIARMPLRFLNC